MKDKLFTPDYNKKRFTITITVCENCNLLNVEGYKPDEKITYQELVGAIEIVKLNLINVQSEENRKQFNNSITCQDCGLPTTEVRPGKHQCINPDCKSSNS